MNSNVLCCYGFATAAGGCRHAAQFVITQQKRTHTHTNAHAFCASTHNALTHVLCCYGFATAVDGCRHAESSAGVSSSLAASHNLLFPSAASLQQGILSLNKPPITKRGQRGPIKWCFVRKILFFPIKNIIERVRIKIIFLRAVFFCFSLDWSLLWLFLLLKNKPVFILYLFILDCFFIFYFFVNSNNNVPFSNEMLVSKLWSRVTLSSRLCCRWLFWREWITK